MEFKGRIYKVMPITEGVNRAGDKWQKQEFLFEYFEHDTDRYTDKVAIGFGHTVREYQGRYYNDIRCYRIEKADSMQVPTAQADDAPKYVDGTNTAQEAKQEENDNLPF